jgi:hypothetical protein
MRGHKLRSGVYWQGALKEKGITQVAQTTRPTCMLMYYADTQTEANKPNHPKK